MSVKLLSQAGVAGSQAVYTTNLFIVKLSNHGLVRPAVQPAPEVPQSSQEWRIDSILLEFPAIRLQRGGIP